MFRSKLLTLFFLFLVFQLYCASSVFPGEVREDCRVCGMWIDQYLHTRHVLVTETGTRISFCSFTCAAKYLKMNRAETKHLQVADYLTTDLVAAQDAFYLVGSDAPPVMSFISVIAFAAKEAAENFQKRHGGRIMTFDEALRQRPGP